jgi:hypothetical protein
MTDPITPPPELVQQWCDNPQLTWLERLHFAYAAGADQELEACCEWVQGYAECGDSLRAARRPKPPSLKKQALEAAIRLGKKYPSYEGADIETIRRALEALPE